MSSPIPINVLHVPSSRSVASSFGSCESVTISPLTPRTSASMMYAIYDTAVADIASRAEIRVSDVIASKVKCSTIKLDVPNIPSGFRSLGLLFMERSDSVHYEARSYLESLISRVTRQVPIRSLGRVIDGKGAESYLKWVGDEEWLSNKYRTYLPKPTEHANFVAYRRLELLLEYVENYYNSSAFNGSYMQWKHIHAVWEGAWYYDTTIHANIVTCMKNYILYILAFLAVIIRCLVLLVKHEGLNRFFKREIVSCHIDKPIETETVTNTVYTTVTVTATPTEAHFLQGIPPSYYSLMLLFIVFFIVSVWAAVELIGWKCSSMLSSTRILPNDSSKSFESNHTRKNEDQ